MHKPDFENFRALLDQLADTFSRKRPDDLQVQAYWNALRDLPLEFVQQGARHHTRYGRFFPKPAELRPKDDKPAGGPAHDGAFHSATAQCERNWAELLAKRDTFAKLLLADALLARYSIAESHGEDIADRMAFLRVRVGELLRIADPAEVIGDPRTCGMVRQIFGEIGVNRLRDGAEAAA